MEGQTSASPTPDFESLWGGEQAVSQEKGGRRSREVKYWKRPSDGFITTGPRVQTDPFDYQRFIQVKHYRELPDSYGFEMIGSLAPDSMTDGRTRLRKFQKNGGITARDENGVDWLMPGKQIVSLLWHRDENIRRARPDVVENAVDVECKYPGCTGPDGQRRRFHGWGRDEAEAACNQHVSAVHGKSEAAEAIGIQNREALVEVAKMFGGQNTGGMSQEQMIQMMAAAMVAAQKMMADQGKIAAVVEELYPPVSADLPPFETGPQYGDVANVTENVTLPPLSRQEIDSMSRSEMMKWAGQHKHLLPYPDRSFNLKTEDWRKLLRDTFYPA